MKDQKQSLIDEERRAIEESNRVAMPGSIRRFGKWSPQRHDDRDHYQAQQQVIKP